MKVLSNSKEFSIKNSVSDRINEWKMTSKKDRKYIFSKDNRKSPTKSPNHSEVKNFVVSSFPEPMQVMKTEATPRFNNPNQNANQGQ